CIGLKIDPDTLNHIRKERLKTLGLDGSASYATIERIKYELDYFNQIAERLDCKVIDVTNKAVEETANIIMDEMRK
ncbi:kinase/pyrophosphorylase, partial [Parvimonas sp. D9]